jgi:hypothetical protein
MVVDVRRLVHSVCDVFGSGVVVGEVLLCEPVLFCVCICED